MSRKSKNDKKRGQYKREELFNVYSVNYKIVRESIKSPLYEFPEIDDAVACPLCFRVISRIDLETPEVLTLEHVPPSSVGGKSSGAILLCKKCNNNAGTLLDSQLQKGLVVRDFNTLQPGATVEGNFSLFEREQIPMQMSVSEDHAIKILIDLNRTSPSNAKRILDSQPVLPGRFSFQLGFPKINPELIEVNLLRIAYLMLFRSYGYCAILHPSMLGVREQILNPTKQIIPSRWVLPISDLPLGINFVKSPQEIRSFFISFQLETRRSSYKYVVVLPALYETGFLVYDWLRENNGRLVSFDYELRKPSSTYLTDPELALYTYYYWL